MEDILTKAISEVKQKIVPLLTTIETTPQLHTTLYNMLNIFDIPDTETEGKVKFIYDFLMENGGNPRDQVMSIHTQLGALSTTPLVNRVYRYCRLKEQARKALIRYENIQREINALGSSGRN